MSKIKVEQSNTQIEEIKFGVIKNLYNFDKKSNQENNNHMKGRLHSLGEYEYQLQYLHNKYYPDLIISADKYYFYFNDPEVERICIDLWSSDRQGCTLEDIQNVIHDNYTTITPFKDNTLITEFNELNQFTNIKVLYGRYFEGCTNLKTVNLENIISFYKISGMQDTYMFNNCSSLQKIYTPHITDFGRYAFNNCTSLKYIVGPLINNISRIDGCWIAGCSNLEYILLGKIQEIRGGGQWSNGEFNGIANLKVVDLGDNLNNITNLPFKGCSNMKAIIIRNTDVIPTVNEYGDSYYNFARRFGNNNVKFFVSDNLLNDYKNSSDWNEMLDKLYPLSEFNLSDYIDFEIPEVEDLYNNLNTGS